MLSLPSILALLFLGGILTWTASVSASCLNNVHNDTIGFFSNAALAFGFEYPSITECAGHCDRLEHCRAWLFHGHAGECQLYRNIPVANAVIPGFTYGTGSLGVRCYCFDYVSSFFCASSYRIGRLPVENNTAYARHISRVHLKCGGFKRDYGTDDAAFDEQASHSSWLAGTVYARGLQEAPGHVEARRQRYRAISREWHAFLGFETYLGPRKRSWEEGEVRPGQKRQRQYVMVEMDFD
ncbi:hypothetical protein CNMCM5793_007558 [Aspergillus hiratsukae]|uniref:Apple domain-containing protein n=1 Tax=Aspergillus hiratsukae TaxID=1194566 RepID=A0A8H6UH97_9EURO|nr:hypothetical protein CNMCM5793_007558 [Aspergillus hiratsukae]